MTNIETDIIFDKTTGKIFGTGKFNHGGNPKRTAWGRIDGRTVGLPQTPEMDFLTVSNVLYDEYVTVERQPGVWKVVAKKFLHPQAPMGDSINITKVR